MPGRYSRPVLAVGDAPLALAFYTDRLGFQEDWRHEENGRLRIAQVSREGCEVIFSDQWPEEAGRGRLFIALDRPDFDRLLADTKDHGVETKLPAGGMSSPSSKILTEIACGSPRHPTIHRRPSQTRAKSAIRVAMEAGNMLRAHGSRSRPVMLTPFGPSGRVDHLRATDTGFRV